AFIIENQVRFEDYLKSYRKRYLELLAKRGPVTGDYPESVHTTWALNFHEVAQAPEPAADLLRLSAFWSPDSIPLELLTEGAAQLGPALSVALAGYRDDPLVLDMTLTPLTRFSLIRRDIEARTYSIHRLVQAVVKSEMDLQTQRLWAERAVWAVSCVFPQTDFSNWQLCERLLPHARVSADLIEAWGLISQDTTRLMYRVGAYLRERGYADEAYRVSERAARMGQVVAHPSYGITLISLAAAECDR